MAKKKQAAEKPKKMVELTLTEEQLAQLKRENGALEPVTLDAQSRLAEIMADTPTIAKLAGTEWEITGLKPGTQMLIAAEACKMAKNEETSLKDILMEFSLNMESVIKILTLALLNDRDRIYKDYARKEYSDEYYEIQNMLTWGEYDESTWVTFLAEVLIKVQVDFFFESTRLIKTVRQQTLARKETREEASL